MNRKRTTLATRAVDERARRMRRTAVGERPGVRGRLGTSVDPEAPLPQVAVPGSELADELLVIEMRLLRALRRHATEARKETAADGAVERKRKIVAALTGKR